MTGIYMIQNRINNHVYIGQALNIEERTNTHKYSLIKNKHENKHLQRAWNKYGKENFLFSVLEECNEEILTEREQYWIDYYGGINSQNTYNQRDAGSRGRMSDEAREKIRVANKNKIVKPGRKVCEEGRMSISKAHMGLHPSDETRRKMSEAHKGFKHTDETKRYLSAKAKKRFEDNPQLAKDISERMRGRKVSEETRQKLSEMSSKRVQSDDEKKKRAESLKRAYAEGRKRTVQITAFGITKSQTEWSELLNTDYHNILYQKKKGTAEQYIEKKILQIVENKGMLADAVVDGVITKNKEELIDFLLS